MLSKVVSSSIFKVFGITRPGIEPRSPGPLANFQNSLKTLFTYASNPLMMACERFENTQDNLGKFIHQFQPEAKTLIRNLERILIKLYKQNVSLLFNQTCLTRINKQYNMQGSTKSLNISYSEEIIDIKTDNIIAKLNLAYS